MKMEKIKQILVLVFIISSSCVIAQSDQDSAMDVSKPTNFYTLLENNLEFTSAENTTIIGYRANFTYSISPKHLLLIEAPLLYSTNTKKFGVGDLRARYFWLPYKNYEKLFGAFGPSVDIFAATGNYDNGLGTGRWIIAPGVTASIMLAEWIQFFPVLSYQYVSKSSSNLIPDSLNVAMNGISFQIVTPVIFSEKFFTQITPVFTYSDFNDEKSFGYIQELLLSYGIKQNLWVSAFYMGNFKNDIHSIRVGLTVYL